MFRGVFLKKYQTGFKTILKLLPRNTYLVSNLLADIFISMKDFQNFWTKILPKLAKCVCEVPYSVPYATGLDIMGGNFMFKGSVSTWFNFALGTE